MKKITDIINLIRKNYAIILIFILALSIRSVMLYNLHDTYFLSSANLGEMARNILNGRWFVINEPYTNKISADQETFNKPIDFENYPPPAKEEYTPNVWSSSGYSILLAATWKLFGKKKYIYLQVIQIIIDSFCIFLIYLMAGRIFSRKVGLLASFLFAIYIPESRLAVAGFRDVWATFTCIFAGSLLVFSTTLSDTKKRFIVYILIGFIVGLGAYIRGTVFLLPFFLGIALAVHYKSIKEATIAGIIMMSIVILTMLPLTIKNYILYHKILLLGSCSAGHAMYTGFGEYPNKYGITFNDLQAYQTIVDKGYKVKYGTIEYDKACKKEAMKIIKENPLWYIGIILRRIPRATLFLNNVWGFEKDRYSYKAFKERGGTLFEYAIDYPFQFLIRALTRLCEGFLFVLAIVGIWLSRKKIRETILLIIIPVYFISVYVPFHIQSRHILSGTWPYLIFTAVFLLYFTQKFSK